MRTVASLLCFAASLAHAASLPNGAATVEAIPMDGPYPSIEAYCAEAGCRDDATMCGNTNPVAGAGFSDARVVAVDGECKVALRTTAGWYASSIGDLPLWSGFLHNGDRYASTVSSVRPSDDGKSLLFRGTFVHATTPEKMRWAERTKREGWMDCEERLFVCAIGERGPGCAGPFPTRYTTFCRDDEHVERALHVPSRGDFHFATTVEGHSLHVDGKGARTAFLPGWAVVAIDGDRLKNVKRTLSPSVVKLVFP